LAEIKSFPNNQDVYVGAEWVMKWLHGRTSGVFGAENNLATSIVPGTMSVQVSDGVGWMSNDKGDGVVFWNDNEQTSGTKLTLTHDVADGVLNRIDRIVVTWETTNYVALPTISILKGVASSNPVAPALTNNNIQRQISLAKVSIPAGTVSLSNSMVTDERLDPKVCGIVTETIKIDTSTMQSQFEALLEAIQNELAGIVGGTGFDPSPVRFENVSVIPRYFATFSASDDEESKLIEMGYEYRASVPVSGVTETMFPYLTFSLFDLEESGVGIANQFRCYNGGVYVYSDGVPENNINILTAEFRKAVS
jgi:hypothetical protein